MRHQHTWFWLVILLGMGARAMLAFSQPADFTSDNDGYLAHAHPVASGEGFIGPYSHRPTAFRPPAYPMALGILIRCGFRDAAAVLVINAVASGLILLLTWTLAGQVRLPAAVALLATLLAAFDPLLLRYFALPMTEVSCAAVLLGAVVCFRSAVTARPASIRMAVVSGILFGIGTMIRPVVLVACVLLTLQAAFRRPIQNEPPGLRPSTFRYLILVLPAFTAAVTLAPWVVRNAIQFHRFIPFTTHGGYTLSLGNNPDFYRDVIHGNDSFPWDGTALDAWQQKMIGDSANDGVLPGDEPATDAWYYRKATETIREDPRSFLKATLLRLRRFWAWSTADERVSGSITTLVSLWYVTLWIGLAIQLVGGLRSGKTEQSGGLVDLWLVVLSFMLMHAVYWTDARMRAPLMPILCLISASGWWHAYCVIVDPKAITNGPSSMDTRISDKAET